MSDQEIIENGQYLVRMLGLLHDYASDLVQTTGRELNTQLLSNYTEQIRMVLEQCQLVLERLRSAERELTRRESELDGRDVDLQELRKRAGDLELELSTANSAVQKLEDQRAAGQRDRDTLMASLQSAIERVTPVVSRELEIAVRERAADEALRKNEELVTRNTAVEDRLAQETQEVSRAQEARRSAEATLRRDQQALEQDKRGFEAARSQLEQDRAILEDSLRSAEQDRKQLGESLDRVKKQENNARALRAEAEEEKRLSEVARAEADSLKAEADSLRAEAGSAKAEADSLKADADSLKAEADSLKAEAGSAKAEAVSLKAEADLALQKAQAKKSAAEQLESESASRLVFADERLDGILGGLENLKSVLASCEEKDAEAGRNISETASSVQKATDLAARLEEDRAGAAGDAANSRAELAEILNQLGAAQREESANLASSVSINQQAKDILEGTNQSVRERIQSVEQSRDGFKTQAEGLDRQLRAARVAGTLHRDSLDRKTTAFERDVRSLTDSMDLVQATVDRQTDELRSQEADLIHLKRDRDALELEVRRAKAATESAEEKVDPLDAEVRTLRYRSKAAEEKAAELQKTVDELRAQASDAEKKRKAGQDQVLQSLTNSLKELRVEATARISNRALEEKVAGLEQELQDSREECKRARTERGNRELESRQGDRADLGQPLEDSPARSNWDVTVRSMLEYLGTLKPVSSGDWGPGFVGADGEVLMRALANFMPRQTKRDRFTKFLEARDKPDNWYCMEHICAKRHESAEPLEGRCPLHHKRNDCSLQVRHLDSSSGGRTLDFRAPIPDESNDK